MNKYLIMTLTLFYALLCNNLHKIAKLAIFFSINRRDVYKNLFLYYLFSHYIFKRINHRFPVFFIHFIYSFIVHRSTLHVSLVSSLYRVNVQWPKGTNFPQTNFRRRERNRVTPWRDFAPPT